MELGNLPQELIVEILCRLSFKDVMRSKCICKQWQMLISNPTFLHYRRQLRFEARSTSNYKKSSNPLQLLVCSTYFIRNRIGITEDVKSQLDLYKSSNINNEDSRTLKLALEHRREVDKYAQVISSSFLELVLVYVRLTGVIYLHNPSTDEFLILSKSRDREEFGILEGVGLGRVESTKEYKVVRLIYRRGILIYEVFTLGLDAHWRKVADPPINVYSDPCVFVAGGLYMFDDDCGLLRFDIEREDWMEIRPPKQYWSSDYTMREVDGLLCMTDNSTLNVCMWVLKDYEKGEWALEKSVEINYNFWKFFNHSPEYTLLYPLSFDYAGGKMLLMSSNENTSAHLNKTKLFSYDPITLHVEQLPNPYPTTCFTATFFTESFESLL